MIKNRESFFLFSGLFFQFLFCFLLMYSDLFYIPYLVSFEFCLLCLVFICRYNVVFFVLALSFTFYFYQVPLLPYFPEVKVDAYNYIYNKSVGNEVLALYSFVLVVFSSLLFLSLAFNKVDILEKAKEKLSAGSSLSFIVASFFCLLLLFYAIASAGGITELHGMNKFEAHEASKFVFFTYKEFFVLMALFFFVRKKKSLLCLLLLLSVIFFELFLAKRYLILVFGVFFILFTYKRLDARFLLYIILSVLFVNLTKLFYYSLPFAILNDVPDFWGAVFYFDTAYFLSNIYHIGEFSGHIRLTYLALEKGLVVETINFFYLLLASLPLSDTLFGVKYISVGEQLRLFLGEGWAGLASSTYIMPYLTFGHLGVLFIYVYYFAFLNFVLYLSTINRFFLVLSLCTLPTLVFYFHREPILILFKNFIISFPIVFVFFVFFLGMRFFIKAISKVKV